MSIPPWWTDAVRLRVGLLKRPQPQVPHLTKPKYAETLNELDRFATWMLWYYNGKKGPRPDFEKKVPAWAWQVFHEYTAKHPHPKPPPTPPPPPVGKPSWTLTNGPWILEGPGGGWQDGPWTKLDIKENEICPGAPLWSFKQDFPFISGKVPQAEGDNQAKACVDWIRENTVVADSVSVVTTLGFPVKPFLDLHVTSCFVECFLQEQDNALDKMGEASREGWPDSIPCVGVYHDFPFKNYLPWLDQYGKRFAIFSSDGMQPSDWDDLKAYIA